MAKSKAAKSATRKSAPATKSASSTTKNPPSPSAPRSSRWDRFLAKHLKPYTAVFATDRALPPGVTLTKAVRKSLGELVKGAWETTTGKVGAVDAIVVRFAEKRDFDAVKAHHKGKSWQSFVPGSVDAFTVRL